MFGMTYVSYFISIKKILFLYTVVFISCMVSVNQSDEDLYIKLEKEIMCPVCDGQTLDQSQSLIAEDMKNSIKEKIGEGYNESEIKNYFVERYGENVLAYPSVSGFNLLAYICLLYTSPSPRD